jgi:3-oxoadipate enol-lactonase
MSAVVDQRIASALASATANDNPRAVAFVREGHMRRDAECFARSCEGLGQAEKADHRLFDWTLIVTGDEDAVGPPSVAQELADKIGGAKTVILNRCGHWTPIEKSKECGKLLSESCAEFRSEKCARHRPAPQKEEASWPMKQTA